MPLMPRLWYVMSGIETVETRTPIAKCPFRCAFACLQPFTSQSREEFLNDLKGKYSDIVAIYRSVLALSTRRFTATC